MLDISKYQVSNEGFFDKIKDLIKILNKKDKPKPPKRKEKDKKHLELYSEQIIAFYKEREQLLKDYKEAINKTYLNDKLLNEYVFVENDIAAKDITKAFILNSKYREDFHKVITENFQNLKKLDEYKIIYNERVKKAGELDRSLCNETKSFKDPGTISDDEAIKSATEIGKIIKPYLNKIENMDTLEKHIDKLPKSYLPNFIKNPNRKHIVSFIEIDIETPDKLNPLDKTSIKDIAKISVEIIDYLLNMVVWKNGGSYEDDGEVVRKYYDYEESLLSEWYELTYYQSFWYYELSELEEGLMDVLLALEKYMERSIK